MIKKNIIPILSVIVIVVSLYTIYNKLYKEKGQTNTNNDYTIEDELNRERELEKLEIQSEKIQLGQVVLQDKDNKEVLLENIIQGKCLVYIFSASSCFPCVETDIKHIKKLSGKIDKNKILIITNYSNFRYYKIFMKQQGISLNCYNSKAGFGLEIENDRNNIPFYFIINSKKEVELVHARKENDNVDDAYFKKIITYLKND